MNHVLAMQRRLWERMFSSFERHTDLIESLQDSEAGRSQLSPVEEKLLLEETKTGCLTGMLLAAKKAPLVDSAMELKLQNVLRDQPMYSSPDFKRLIRVMLKRREIGEIVDFR